MLDNASPMSRRTFLVGSGAVLGLAALASPLLAQGAGDPINPWLGRKLTASERMTLQDLGSYLRHDLRDTGLTPAMMDNHLRLRIPGADIFAQGKDTLLPNGVAVMTFVAEAMRYRKSVRLEVVGHHDKMAPDYDALIFTRRRAEAARAALMSRGVDLSRILATGLGAKFPYTEDGRNPKNQRLELLFRPL